MKIRIIISIITLINLLISLTSFSQNNSIVINGAYIVLDGGTAANNINIVVNQTNPAGIIRLPSGGYIHSENQYNFIKWVTGTSTGSYVFPFGVVGNSTDSIPFTFNKTTGNSSISVSTWSTNQQNIPHANTTNVAAVSSMTGTADSVLRAVDRFWDIQVSSPTTADLTFSYRGIENTTAFPTDTAKAQHWNGTSWDTQAGPGNIGVTTGIGSVGPIPNQTTFSPWILTIAVVCPNASFTYASPFCAGDTSSILPTIAVNGITGTFSATPIGLVFTDTLTGELNIAASMPGTYMIYNSLSATGSCPARVDSFQIVINPYPTGTTTATICQGDSILLSGTYQTTAGVYSDTLIVVGGCDSIITTTLTVDTPPNPVISGSLSFCAGASTTLDAGSGYSTYTWSPSGNTQTLIVTSSGTYAVTVTNANGCQGSDTVAVLSNNPIIINITTTQTGCTTNDGTATANVSGGTPGYTYNWDNGQSTQIDTGLGEGTYTITVTDGIGCTQTQTATVGQIPGPTVTVSASQIALTQGDSTIITASGGSIYQWTSVTGLSCYTCTNPTATPMQTTTYCVQVTDDNGCTDSTCIEITVETPPCGELFVPNAFSPNGDGVNDILFVRGQCIKTLLLSIYDRWGELIFETDNQNIGWDGTYKGKELDDAVFVYYLKVEYDNGTQEESKGNISLIR